MVRPYIDMKEVKESDRTPDVPASSSTSHGKEIKCIASEASETVSAV
jgi:hypothetical protein